MSWIETPVDDDNGRGNERSNTTPKRLRFRWRGCSTSIFPTAGVRRAGVGVRGEPGPFINIGYAQTPTHGASHFRYWLWDTQSSIRHGTGISSSQEFASAAVIRFGGHLATNSLTVAVSLLGLWFFARIVAKIELPNRALVVVGFAFTPLLWINRHDDDGLHVRPDVHPRLLLLPDHRGDGAGGRDARAGRGSVRRRSSSWCRSSCTSGATASAVNHAIFIVWIDIRASGRVSARRLEVRAQLPELLRLAGWRVERAAGCGEGLPRLHRAAQSSSRSSSRCNGWRGCRSTSSVTKTSRSGAVIAITLVVFGRLPHESGI